MIRPVPHRHLVFALPKVLRPAFRYRRKLLARLALCAWKAVSAFIRDDTGQDALLAAIVSIQTAGEFLNWHPHLHILAPAGAFRRDGSFVHSPLFNPAVLRDLFQANVLALLLKERMISPELVERMKDWRHSGFHAFAGEEIPDVEDALRVGLYEELMRKSEILVAIAAALCVALATSSVPLGLLAGGAIAAAATAMLKDVEERNAELTA